MIPIPKDKVLRYQDSTAGTRTIVPKCDGTIYNVVQQTDGKIIFVGIFTNVNGVPNASGIARLNSNGSVDTSFVANTGTGATGDSGSISKVLLQSDGKILIAGQFTLFNGSTATRIARLNPDGTLDTAFMTNIGTGPTTSRYILSIALQTDGKIVVSGTFESWNGVTTVGGIVRLNSDGTRDSSFVFDDTDVSGQINAMAVQSDGKIVLVGTINQIKGVSCNCVARLNSDGSLDTAFTAAVEGPYDSEYSPVLLDVAIQPDGKIIIVGGDFSSWIVNSVSQTAVGIVRLNSNGTVEFRNESVSYSFRCIYIQSDGSFLLGGVESLYRVTSNGTFSSNFGPSNGGLVDDVIQLSSGDIFAIGGFSEWSGNTLYKGFVKINSTTLAISMSDFDPLPDLVFAIVVGSGNAGGASGGGGGGGAGAIVYGLVPASNKVTVGAGPTGLSSSGGEPSLYSTLYAAGGGIGTIGSTPSVFGAGATPQASLSSSTTVASNSGSVLFTSIGGESGNWVISNVAGAVAATDGRSGVSGGGGGAASTSFAGSAAATGGNGGSGLIGGGGGGARQNNAANGATATAGSGGSGVYPGGTGATRTGTSTKYVGGGGGGGFLGPGGNGTSDTTSTSVGGAGGLGGGGGGGLGGDGGNGCVLLYW